VADQSAARGGGALGLAREVDPLRATWRLFTDMRWAIGIIAFLALASVLGVVVPQVPDGVRGDAAAEGQWLAFQEERFGFLTDPMNRVGLFDVFHAAWYLYALGLLAASVAVCTVSRFPSIWRAVTRRSKRVNDAYFASARQRFDFAPADSGPRLEAVLRRRRFVVECCQEGDTLYLFADRFRFAQFATFVSHLALIVLLAAALVSHFSGFSNDMMIAEGASAPVFPDLKHPDQMQVQLLDAIGRFSPEGEPLEYRSELVIYQGGQEVKRCSTTVNSPCSYKGYRFHQVAYFGFGADVQVRDLSSGNVVYRETLALSGTLPSPHVIVRDAGGDLLLDKALVLTDVLSTGEYTYFGRLVSFKDGRTLTIGVRSTAGGDEWELVVFEPGEGEDAVPLLMREGESARADGLQFTYAGLRGVPSAFVSDFARPPEVSAAGDSGQVLVEMSNVVYGSHEASAGTAVPAVTGGGPPELTIVGLQSQAVTLRSGESTEIGGYEYSFLGQREFAGIEVKKDRSDYLVWIGAGMLVAGMVVTFWVPWRRLWAKITPTRIYMAGQSGRLVDFRREMAELAQRAGAELDEEKGHASDG
jgi:cytochrome c biogenesis protein ResB